MFVLVISAGPWAFGQALRSRGHRVDELAARAGRLELERRQAGGRRRRGRAGAHRA